jgi:serine-type D-Ala-D-Ala carboxypeptidase
MRYLLINLLCFSSLAQARPATDYIAQAIRDRIIPGAVLLVDHQQEEILNYSAGSSQGDQTPDPAITLYDIASLTKVITATAIMLLEENGRLVLSDRLQKYYPHFNQGKKAATSIEDLLRHKGGVPAGVGVRVGESYQQYIRRLTTLALVYPPGTQTVYSDVGFIILGDLVQQLSGMSLSEFVQRYIFEPLQMQSTFYQVAPKNHWRCAPTSARRSCRPHDPKASALYPAPLGHAGLFSTAQDLRRLVRMYLNQGRSGEVQLLKASTIEKMTKLPLQEIRGLGWDLKSPFATSPRGEVFPEGISYGHTGYTGTTIWIDPDAGGALIFLSNRVLMGDGPTARPFVQLRRDIGTSVGRLFYP